MKADFDVRSADSVDEVVIKENYILIKHLSSEAILWAGLDEISHLRLQTDTHGIDIYISKLKEEKTGDDA